MQNAVAIGAPEYLDQPQVGSGWTYFRRKQHGSVERIYDTAMCLSDSLVMAGAPDDATVQQRYGRGVPFALAQWQRFRSNQKIVAASFELSNHGLFIHHQPAATTGAWIGFSYEDGATGFGIDVLYEPGNNSMSLPRVSLSSSSPPLDAPDSSRGLARQVGVIEGGQSFWDEELGQVQCTLLVLDVLQQLSQWDSERKTWQYASPLRHRGTPMFIYLPVLVPGEGSTSLEKPLAIAHADYKRLARMGNQVLNLFRHLDPDKAVTEVKNVRYFQRVDVDSDGVLCLTIQWRHLYNLCATGEFFASDDPTHIRFPANASRQFMSFGQGHLLDVHDISPAGAKEAKIVVAPLRFTGSEREQGEHLRRARTFRMTTAVYKPPSEVLLTTPPSVMLTWDILEWEPTAFDPQDPPPIDFRIKMPARLVTRHGESFTYVPVGKHQEVGINMNQQRWRDERYER